MTLSAAKDTLFLIEISRQEVETGDIAHVASVIGQLIGDRSSLLSAEGCVSLMFGGYDHDPRPIHTIPEVRAWFRSITEARPYWSILANRTDETVGVLMALLLPGEEVQGDLPGQLGWRFEMSALPRLLATLFCGQNQLVAHFDISTAENNRISNDFMDAVSASID